MAETPEGREKTEPASARRLSEARQRGQVAKSVDITTAAMIVLGGFALLLYIPFLTSRIKEFFGQSLRYSFMNEMTTQNTLNLFFNILLFLGQYVLPIILLFYLIILFAEISQVGFNFATKKFTKGLNFRTVFNPLTGLRRMFFSGRSYFELLKSLLKLTILGWVTYSILRKYMEMDLALVSKPVTEITSVMFDACLELLAKMGAIYILLAIADRYYQKYRYKQDLKMTKEEVKEESRQSEGDPLVRSRIRALMRQRLRKIMMKNVQKADVIVTNPTHFAVALEYKPNIMNAPIVVAKGLDFMALRIRELAEEYQIPIVEEPPLAQALYYSVEVEQEIPEFLFKAVAQVLAYVYYLKIDNG